MKKRILAAAALLLLLSACAKAPAAESGLSPAEEAAAQRVQRAVADDSLPAGLAEDAALRTVYGGQYVDEDGVPTICLTEDTEETRAAFRALLDGEAPQFQVVEFSYDELTAARHLALARIETARATGALDFEYRGGGVHVAGNCVRFKVSDPQAAARLCEDILPGGFAYVDSENEVYRP